jgi:cytochrome c oxidase subunit I+III
MHITGLLGMPRRVWTYPAELGWEWLNLCSTAGAYLLAGGVLVFLVDLARNFRPRLSGGDEDENGNVWGAGTLEWLPNETYGVRSIPFVTSRDPLWEQPDLQQDVRRGGYYLPDAPTGRRETIVTSARDAKPQYVVRLPGPGWAPVLAGWFTAFFFLSLTLKLAAPAFACAAISLAMVVVWMWSSDPAPLDAPVAIGGGLSLPAYATGARSHSGWAVLVFCVVAGAIFAALVFSYFFLWLGAPDVWPSRSGQRLPHAGWPLAIAACLASSSAAIACGSHALTRSRTRLTLGLLLLALVLIGAALGCDLFAQIRTGLLPTEPAYGAVVYAALALQGVYVFTLAVIALFVGARWWSGRLDARWRASWDNTALLWHYTVGQGLLCTVLVHGAPRWLG